MPDDVVELVQKLRRPLLTGSCDIGRPDKHLAVLVTRRQQQQQLQQLLQCILQF